MTRRPLFPSESPYNFSSIDDAVKKIREQMRDERTATTDLEVRRIRERVGDLRDRLEHHIGNSEELEDIYDELDDIERGV